MLDVAHPGGLNRRPSAAAAGREQIRISLVILDAARRPLLALLLVLLSFPGAEAHAILVSSQPPANGTVRAGAATIELRFNSRIDAARSKVTLAGPNQQEVVIPVAAGEAENVLLARTELLPGARTLRWQVLAVDGHITRGVVPFTVKGP